MHRGRPAALLQQRVGERLAVPSTHELFELAIKAALGANPWVTASKLCARKRPQFFPVRDNVVTVRRLGLGTDHRVDWLVYRELLGRTRIAGRLERLTA